MSREQGAVVALLVVLLTSAVGSCDYGWHSLDEELVRTFNDHRENFEALGRRAVADDDIATVAPKYVLRADSTVWPGSDGQGFSHQRFGAYRSALSQLGDGRIDRLHRRRGVIYVPVCVRIRELDDFESIVLEKGFAYSPSQVLSSVDSLDGLGFESRGTYYRGIASGWYLYHSWGISKPE